jgi:putative ABC transport system substrate-binding protein
MKRRDFILVAGAAGVWPRAAFGQAATPVIGYLHPGSASERAHLVEAFRKGLAETGYVEGHNVAVEYVWANNDPQRFAELLAEFVRRRTAVIVTPIGTASALAVKRATSTIPVVFSIGTDAVKAGLIVSYSRPGGNLTGVGGMVSELGGKRVELLLELRPQARRIALLANPNNPLAVETSLKDIRDVVAAKGIELDVVHARDTREISTAFDTLMQKRIEGLIISPDPLVGSHRTQLALLSARHRIPTVYPLRDFAVAGGLVSYGPDDADRYRLVGVYAGRVLKGEKPADMPVQQPTKFQLVINLQTARTLGIAIPPTLLARADEVIE